MVAGDLVSLGAAAPGFRVDDRSGLRGGPGA